MWYVESFFKGLKKILVKTPVKLTNHTNKPTLWVSNRFSQGTFENTAGILEMRRNITSPGKSLTP